MALVVYHHDDMDGKGAGWIVHSMKPQSIEDFPENYHMCTYEDKLDKHGENDDVFIVDLSISKSTYPMLLEVCSTARTVTWIDHHQSSLDVIKKHEDDLQAIKNLTYFVSNCVCGTALAYTYFSLPADELKQIRDVKDREKYSIKAEYKDGGFITVDMAKTDRMDATNYLWFSHDLSLPNWIFHIDDYDCHKKLNNATDKFILGSECYDNSLTIQQGSKLVFNSFWDEVSTDIGVLNKYIANGRVIDMWLNAKYKRELSMTFEWEYNGTKFLCKNSTGNSWNFQDVINNYPAVILFEYDGSHGVWTYSVYAADNSTFDCKAFCEQFGGGGHFHAAGFSTKNLIFTSKDHIAESSKKEDVVFLGGTCNGTDWRSKFIELWKKSEDTVTDEVSLFNPVVDDWNEEAQKKEDEIKASARLNLFVIQPDKMNGYFSLIEATECSHMSKVMFAIYDPYDTMSDAHTRSFNAIGNVVTEHGGKYKIYKGEDCIKDIVNDVIAFV